MEPVAQWVERQFVALVVAGSNPVGLPNRYPVCGTGGCRFESCRAPQQVSRFYRDIEIGRGFAKVTLPQSPGFYCKIYRISLIILRL